MELSSELEEHFARLVQQMQTPKSAAAVDALFNATPEELGEAAVKAARIAKEGGDTGQGNDEEVPKAP